jgi:hypothetical protein
MNNIQSTQISIFQLVINKIYNTFIIKTESKILHVTKICLYKDTKK